MMKKAVIGLVIAVVVGIALFILYVYMVLAPKQSDVSNIAPFAELMSQPVTTIKETIIITYPSVPPDEDYAYYLEDGSGFGMDKSLQVLAELPIGTKVNFDKVTLLTGGVSGTTSAYLFGTVFSEEKQKSYNIFYNWGEYRSLSQDQPYWFFGETFWLDKPLEKKFFIEVP
ncbi:hypothetical protein ACFQZJ_04115 [Maribacter chungangensis]|uniref:Uncharacterized protein n=1 Tax=Maribacter chungangensis TaxID=1069117 RepID=A0ABW3B0H6_9FLAO